MLKLSFALLALALSAGSIAAPVISSSTIEVDTSFWLEPNPDYTGGFFDPEPQFLSHEYVTGVTDTFDTTATVVDYTFTPQLDNLHTVEVDYTLPVTGNVLTMIWGWDDLKAGVRITNCGGSGIFCDFVTVGELLNAETIHRGDDTDYFSVSPIIYFDLLVGTQIDRVPLWNDYYGYVTPSSVPVPAAAWLFGSAILGLVGIKRKKA